MREVIVIGSGPAGIAIATQLGERGIDVLVLEKDTRVLGALRRVNPEMKLLTPACLSTLRGMRVRASPDTVSAFERHTSLKFSVFFNRSL